MGASLVVATLAISTITFITTQSANAASGPAIVCGINTGITPNYGWRYKALDRINAYCNAHYKLGEANTSQIDCSGLVMRAYQAAGLGLPHKADLQIDLARKITKASAVAGDVIAYRHRGDSEYHHIAIYLGNNWFIEAYGSGWTQLRRSTARDVYLSSSNGTRLPAGEVVTWGTYDNRL
jgi:cell wall-associated NlpC family hydrolase